MSHISVKNFERFQHYKDRNPKWIKLYNEILDDYDFARLPDASKWLAVGIWLLASRYENRIPNDPEWIGRRINASVPVDLGPLLSAGFITLSQPASGLLADRSGPAMPEREGETEKETTTVADATEAAPRGVTPIEAARAESGSTEQHAPPNSNPEEGPEPDELPAPESAKDARLRMNAIAAPLIREHLWLGKEPPLGATRKHPGWGMKRELNILARLMKEHNATPEEIGAVVEYARPVLEFGPEEPLSALIFQVEGRRDRFRQVLEYARIRRAKEERLQAEREPKPAGNVRIQLHVA